MEVLPSSVHRHVCWLLLLLQVQAEVQGAWKALRALCWCDDELARLASRHWLQQLLAVTLQQSLKVGRACGTSGQAWQPAWHLVWHLGALLLLLPRGEARPVLACALVVALITSPRVLQQHAGAQ